MRSARSPLAVWVAVAAAVRGLSAATHSAWGHPDEWFQTAEFGNLLANGLMSHTQEVGLHMRNLAWPSILAVPLALARWLDPAWVGLRVFLVQILAAAASLAIPWGVDRSLRAAGAGARTRHAALALVVLPFFTVAESVRPGQENLAAAALWATLAMLASGRPMAAGALAVAVGAFKYPAGLLSAGIAAALAWRALRNPRDRVTAARFAAGAGAGILVWGVPDWIFYGRPWESLWMYAQYNLFTGLGTGRFGHQEAATFLTYFRGHWGGALLPIAIAVLPCALWGLYRGIRSVEPWAFAFALYVAGHLAIGHKEPRFMAPVEALALWAAIAGARHAWPAASERLAGWSGSRALRPALGALLAGVFLWNAALTLRAAWGETWVANGTYFEVDRHLREYPSTCAVITVRKPLSIHLPWRNPSIAPEPALGFFPSERREPSFAQTGARPVIWIERPRQCGPAQTLLVHVHKPDPGWDGQGCRLLRSGILNILPEGSWEPVIERGLASGSWYACPASALGAFRLQETRHILARRLGRIARLPPPGATGQELIRAGSAAPGGDAPADGTMGDW